MANEETLQQVRDAAGNWAGIEHGQDTVATAGTAEALNGGTSLAVPNGATVEIAALPGNSTPVYVGDSTVSATNGRALSAGDAPVRLQVTDVSDVYIDVDTAGEGVSWIVEVDA